jgi:hypothetical protein
MSDDTKLVTVVCGSCGNQSDQQIGWLKSQTDGFKCLNAVCGARLKYDPYEFLRLLNEDAANKNSRITLYPIED